MVEPAADRSQSLADRQLADARRDPRLSHGREAVIADWWAAMGAAERVRRLADSGLHALLDSESAAERKLEAEGRTDPDDRDRQRVLEAARQRGAMAAAEQANQLAELNAMTLVAMVSAVDALVEELVPRVRELLVQIRAEEMLNKARELEPEAAGALSEAVLARALEVTRTTLAAVLPKLKKAPRGTGATRWETVLSQVGLQARPDRQIPADLNEALGEVVELRHVIAHRASRVDDGALKKAPTLGYAEGDLVRISRDDYRCYSAALWTYGDEVTRRLLGSAAPQPAPLVSWRQNYTINA
jgi:hypothetical protein